MQIDMSGQRGEEPRREIYSFLRNRGDNTSTYSQVVESLRDHNHTPGEIRRSLDSLAHQKAIFERESAVFKNETDPNEPRIYRESEYATSEEILETKPQNKIAPMR